MRYRFFLFLAAMQLIVLIVMVISGKNAVRRRAPVHSTNVQLVQMLDLTDLSLWTGARYTRHLSQADNFSAFQDSMGALEHFPEGAFAGLPVLVQGPISLVDKKGDDDPTY